jgi:malate permease and related proteins
MNIILIIFYLVIGMGFRRFKKNPDNWARLIHLFVIYVSFPALILLKIPVLNVSKIIIIPLLMPWVSLVISIFLVLIFSSIFKWREKITQTLMIMIPLGNTSFLGFPMVKAFFGEAGIPYAVLYDQFGSFLALSTYGTIMIAIYSGEKKATLKEIMLRIISFPPFIALIIALIFKEGAYPLYFFYILKALSVLLVPFVMFAIGAQLSFKMDNDLVLPLGVGLSLKCVIIPIILLSVCSFLNIDNLGARVSILEAGMPPMVTAGALAIGAGMPQKLIAALVGAGVFVSFLTLPLLHYIMLL